jgi:uncharacterized phage-associated protein
MTYREESNVYNRFLNTKKTLEVLVYLSEKEHDLKRIMKYLYFADKLHMERYGRFITGDYYVKMPEGPVPSGAYDVAKHLRGDDQYFEDRIINLAPQESLIYQYPYSIIPKREANLDYFSQSDIECLDQTILNLSGLSDKALIGLAHEEVAWLQAEENTKMDEVIIIKSLPNAAQILDYINAD